MSEHTQNLKTLHTLLIDSRNGYDEAFKDANGTGLASLFRNMMVFHNHSAEALGAYLNSVGEAVDDRGSVMTTVNRTIMSIRSMFGALDESILPGLIDGEKRIAGHYDAALTTCPADAPELPVLHNQRESLQAKIAQMQAMKATAA